MASKKPAVRWSRAAHEARIQRLEELLRDALLSGDTKDAMSFRQLLKYQGVPVLRIDQLVTR